MSERRPGLMALDEMAEHAEGCRSAGWSWTGAKSAVVV
jgi:hypothetical protein